MKARLKGVSLCLREWKLSARKVQKGLVPVLQS